MLDCPGDTLALGTLGIYIPHVSPGQSSENPLKVVLWRLLPLPSVQSSIFRVQELCESRGGRPGLSVLMSLTVSVDVKQHWTMLRHWSQFVPNMSTDIRGHEALHHHHPQSSIKLWTVPTISQPASVSAVFDKVLSCRHWSGLHQYYAHFKLNFALPPRRLC